MRVPAACLIEAGIFVSIIQVICALLINPVINKDILMYILKPLAINGLICAVVVIATSKIFETIFGEITNFTLAGAFRFFASFNEAHGGGGAGFLSS